MFLSSPATSTLRGGRPLFGDQQPPPHLSEMQRIEQAREINASFRQILTVEPLLS
jgi:hypothetical protein